MNYITASTILLLNLGTVLTLCYFYLTTICSFLVFTVLILQCLRHINTTGETSGAGTAYSSGVPELTFGS
jgi:hypothetical protein